MSLTSNTLPQVSVLMPLYNTQEAHLRTAIESILSQSYSDFELVIINDASPDKRVEEVVLSYTDERIRYMRNDSNLGISKTRNKLIDASKGEFLAVMDHDDISLSNRLKCQVAYLMEHPEVGVVGSQAINKLSGKVFKLPVENRDIKMGLMTGCTILHPASMIRKSILEKHQLRYEEQYSPSEDYILWCRLSTLTDFHNLPEILFEYREHTNNTSHLQADKMKNASTAIQSMIQQQQPELYLEFLKKAHHTHYIRLFGLLPLMKVVRKGQDTRVLLFGLLPLISWRYSRKIK